MSQKEINTFLKRKKERKKHAITRKYFTKVFYAKASFYLPFNQTSIEVHPVLKQTVALSKVVNSYKNQAI